MSDKLVITVKETQRWLGISKGQVYRLIRSGRLETLKLGGCRRITVASLHALVSSATAGAKL